MKKFSNALYIILCCFILSFSINKIQAQCNADFTYSINQNTIYFTAAMRSDTSIMQWNFGDNSIYNEYGGPNTSHTYAEPGTYTVTLTVRDSSGRCTQSSSQNITLNFSYSCSVTFSYNYGTSYEDSIEGNGNPTYYFYAQPQLIGSTVQSYLWTIDGTATSNAQAFSYAFSAPGNHTVCIQIQTANGCISQSCQTINAFTTCNFHPSFTYSFPDPSNLKLLKFIAKPQSDHTAYLWRFSNNFSNLSGDSVENNYNTGGNYSVFLEVIDSSLLCSISDTQTVYVPYSICDTAQASFNYTPNASNSREIDFISICNEPVQSLYWTICDTNTPGKCFGNVYGNDFSYTFPGTDYTYQVCLNVTTAAGCILMPCSLVSVGDSICNSSTLAYTYSGIDTLNNPITFTAVSNQYISSQYWTIKNSKNFSDSALLNISDPVYTFKDSGIYNVCLSATLNNGCSKTFCDTVYINDTSHLSGLNVSLYPNPAINNVKFNLSLSGNAIININVYNINGNNVYTSQISGTQGSNTINIPVQSFPSGQYFVDINYSGQRKTTIFQKF